MRQHLGRGGHIQDVVDAIRMPCARIAQLLALRCLCCCALFSDFPPALPKLVAHRILGGPWVPRHRWKGGARAPGRACQERRECHAAARRNLEIRRPPTAHGIDPRPQVDLVFCGARCDDACVFLASPRASPVEIKRVAGRERLVAAIVLVRVSDAAIAFEFVGEVRVWVAEVLNDGGSVETAFGSTCSRPVHVQLGRDRSVGHVDLVRQMAPGASRIFHIGALVLLVQEEFRIAVALLVQDSPARSAATIVVQIWHDVQIAVVKPRATPSVTC
mmetsp:Transcript_7516/g.19737  ORF Transcript_7516/g.19737 Transcript_7516/m.19737 type:complete len:274 (-) Transcript_7516:1512-2333(-)